MPLSRRAFLEKSARAGGLALALGALPAWLRDAEFDPKTPWLTSGRADLIERNTWPEHWETTVEALGRSFLTPNDAFFVRSHLPVPDLDASEHRLEIGGSVAHPFTLTFAELKKLPKTSLTCVLECAGNGRGLMKLANTSGTQWGFGAVGNATFFGRVASR